MNVSRAAAVGLSLVLVACSSNGDDPQARSSTGTAATETSTTTTAPPPVTLPAPPPYQPLPGEPSPEIKLAAASVVQALLTHPVGGGTTEAATQRIAGLPAVPEVAAQVQPLLRPQAASSAEIVYPQYGGLLETSASVMVVVRHRVRTEDIDDTVVRTMDVRVERRPEGWVVTQLASLGGERPPDGPLSPAAAAVLDNPRIELPTSARWDIKAGRVDERVLTALTTIAAEHTLAVTTFSTGHPVEVFGTSSTSNHTEGRAVDVWEIDDRPVLEQRTPDGPLAPLIEQLLGLGVTELGGPIALGGASFANTLHQDHLHIGFDQ